MRTVKEDLQTSSIIKTYIHTYTLFLIFIKILFKQIIYIYAYNIIEMKLISTRAAEEKNFFLREVRVLRHCNPTCTLIVSS